MDRNVADGDPFHTHHILGEGKILYDREPCAADDKMGMGGPCSPWILWHERRRDRSYRRVIPEEETDFTARPVSHSFLFNCWIRQGQFPPQPSDWACLHSSIAGS